jgi:hypothetical protein
MNSQLHKNHRQEWKTALAAGGSHPWRGSIALKAFLPLLACSLLVLSHPAHAAGPQPPCAASGSYPALDASPVIGIWHGKELEHGNWQPPLCTGWPANSRSKLLITLTGSFHFNGTMEALLARVGAISSLRTIRYWSVTEKEWGPMAYDASALSDGSPQSRRNDFSGADFVKGADLYYWENDTRMGETVYRLHIHESSPERVMISSDNITPIKRFFFTLFKPDSLQSLLFIQRLSPGIFGVYIMNRAGEGTSALASGHEESYVNRATALYRQLAGMKTDQEPPAMR